MSKYISCLHYNLFGVFCVKKIVIMLIVACTKLQKVMKISLFTALKVSCVVLGGIIFRTFQQSNSFHSVTNNSASYQKPKKRNPKPSPHPAQRATAVVGRFSTAILISVPISSLSHFDKVTPRCHLL